DDRDTSKPPPLENQYAPKPSLHSPSKKEFEMLYVEVLYTIKHKIGITIGGHLPFIQDLYQYAQQAFKVSPEDHARLLAQATKEKPPIVILNATVLEARNLEAKDADGFSDPYCMLGIMPGRRMQSFEGSQEGSMGSSDEENSPRSKDKAFKRFSLKKKSAALRDMLPAKYIQTTSVRPNTLNPVWNEKFRFDLEDVKTDRVHLDIWDHDDEFSVIEAAKKLNEVQGIKGLGRYFKQVAQSARTSKSSGNTDIPSSGHEKWYQLEGRSSRSSVDGQIKLRLTLATREDRGIPEDDNWTDVRQHEDLMRGHTDGMENFLRLLRQSYTSTPYKGMLLLYSKHRWMAYSRKHLEHPLDYQVLLGYLQDLDKLWEPTSLSREEEECLAESLTRFIDHSLALIHRQREVFPTNNRQAMQRLEGMLRCLSGIYSMQVFKRTCPFHKELHPEITIIIKRCHKRTAVAGEEDVIHGLLELTNQLNADLHHAVIFYNKLYEQLVDVQYFRVTYQVIEKLFGEEVTGTLTGSLTRLERADAQQPDSPGIVGIMGTQLFELYLALQEFCKFKEHLPNSIKKDLSICRYYQWFTFAVKKWLHIAKQKAYKRIHKAVELDKTVDIKSGVKYSTSAVDMTEFWRNLDWPDVLDALPMARKLTEDVCAGAALYADLIHEKLRRAGYYDDEGQFDVTEQFNEIQTALENQNVKNRSKYDLNLILNKTDQEMVGKIKNVVDRVADKMRPDIKKDVFHLNWAPDAVPADDAIGDLLEYLDSNLLVMNNNLLKSNFDRILESIWIECLEEFREALDAEEAFFNANDKGLLMQNIVCPLYQDLKHELSLHKMDTFDLIEAFYEEKLQEQHMFPSVPSQTTKIVKKTLNPEFDESFEFNVSLTQCKKKGAALVFTVMDHDYVFQNDFAGEVFMALSEIPGVDGDEVSGYEALNVVTLPLTQPSKRKTGALAVLSTRDWDKAAQDLVKLRSKVQDQST
ncbi:BAIP3-like protein, partial [Mya arenaria]